MSSASTSAPAREQPFAYPYRNVAHAAYLSPTSRGAHAVSGDTAAAVDHEAGGATALRSAAPRSQPGCCRTPRGV